MDENKPTNTNPESGSGERTFTQDQLNDIVSRRLAEEKAKGEKTLLKGNSSWPSVNCC